MRPWLVIVILAVFGAADGFVVGHLFHHSFWAIGVMAIVNFCIGFAVGRRMTRRHRAQYWRIPGG